MYLVGLLLFAHSCCRIDEEQGQDKNVVQGANEEADQNDAVVHLLKRSEDPGEAPSLTTKW